MRGSDRRGLLQCGPMRGRARVKLVPLVFVLAGFARRLHRAAGTPCAGVSLVAGLNCKYPTCASRHNHTRRTVWLRHNPLLRRKLFRVFGSMSAPSEGPQAKSLPSPASACATTGLWLKGQSLALRRWWPLHDMHPAWCAGRRFFVARLTGAARSVCSGRFGRVATKMVPQGRFWAGASDEKRCVRSVGSLGCVECGLGAGLDCGGWHHGLLLPS